MIYCKNKVNVYYCTVNNKENYRLKKTLLIILIVFLMAGCVGGALMIFVKPDDNSESIIGLKLQVVEEMQLEWLGGIEESERAQYRWGYSDDAGFLNAYKNRTWEKSYLNCTFEFKSKGVYSFKDNQNQVKQYYYCANPQMDKILLYENKEYTLSCKHFFGVGNMVKKENNEYWALFGVVRKDYNSLGDIIGMFWVKLEVV